MHLASLGAASEQSKQIKNRIGKEHEENVPPTETREREARPRKRGRGENTRVKSREMATDGYIHK
tara:strand:- start:154 stop:348 length:195 start_codon:yes stop_codon:yes gene_type:complete